VTGFWRALSRNSRPYTIFAAEKSDFHHLCKWKPYAIWLWYTHLLVHLPDVVILDGKDDEASGILAQEWFQRGIEWGYRLLHEWVGGLSHAILHLTICLMANGHLANIVGALRQNLLAGTLFTRKTKKCNQNINIFSLRSTISLGEPTHTPFAVLRLCIAVNFSTYSACQLP